MYNAEEVLDMVFDNSGAEKIVFMEYSLQYNMHLKIENLCYSLVKWIWYNPGKTKEYGLSEFRGGEQNTGDSFSFNNVPLPYRHVMEAKKLDEHFALLFSKETVTKWAEETNKYLSVSSKK